MPALGRECTGADQGQRVRERHLRVGEAVSGSVSNQASSGGDGGGKQHWAAEVGAHRLQRRWQRPGRRLRSWGAAGSRAGAPASPSITLPPPLASPQRPAALAHLI